MDQTSNPSLEEVLHTGRTSFEHALSNAIGGTDTTGSCLFACVLLKALVEKWTDFIPLVKGGAPVQMPPGGYFDGQRWRGHYWLELQLNGKPEFIADITVD